MEVRPLLLAGAVLVMGARAARADFIVTITKSTSGANEVYRLFALNNGANGTGTQLQSIDVTRGFPRQQKSGGELSRRRR